MPYRRPGQTAPNDASVLCRRCGEMRALSLVDKRHDVFTCARCQHEQPVLRDDAELTALRHVSHLDGSYAELGPFASATFGLGTVLSVTMLCDGIEATVGLSINSGSVMGIDFTIVNTGLPEMRLAKETREHVQAKEKGVAREVQTGDAAFDPFVYIESEATDEVVLTVLAAPAVRSAILGLLRTSDEVRIKDGSITTFVSRNAPNPYFADAIRQRLAWLRVLAGGPRPLVQAYVAVPAAARLLQTAVFVLMPLGVGSMVLGCGQYTPLATPPGVAAAAIGLVVALGFQPIARRVLSGRSTSLRDIKLVRIITFLWLPVLALGVAMISNGVFDRSPEHSEVMFVFATKKDDDGRTVASVRDARGRKHDYTFSSDVGVGSKLLVGVRDGAFGWPWESRGPIVVEAR